MTRTLHDTFAKEGMKELLTDFGEVEIEAQLSPEVRTIDLLFRPHPHATQTLQVLGLLGRLIAAPCIIEPFRNAVPTWEIRNCRSKLVDLEAYLRRQTKRKHQRLSQVEFPFLWIFSPTLSKSMQKSFCMKQKPQWGNGIYFLPDPDRTAIVAIHHLPKTVDTLWIRLFGKGKVQSDAIAELLDLPDNHPYRQETIGHLATLRIQLQTRQNKTKSLREVVMSLSPVYEQWRQATLQEGRQEGLQEMQIAIALRMLAENMSLDTIAQLTGLPMEEIQRLQDDRSDS
jgi:hypothetical protein